MTNEEAIINEGFPPSERSPDYPKILAQIEDAIQKGKEGEYINDRLAVLTEKSEKGEMSHIHHSIHQGFIGPEMLVRRNMMVDPLTLDDVSLYTELFETIKRFQNTDGWKGKTIREIIPNVIQFTLSKYFGNITAHNNTERQNQEFYLDHNDSESSTVSIKELQGKGFAVCAEKASAAQNLLTFVGLESTIIASASCRLPSDNEEVPHYFNLIYAPKNDLIYDPTNPVLVLNEKREIITCSPAMYPINEEQEKILTQNGSVTVKHIDEILDSNGNKILEESSRTYSGPRKNS